MSETFTEYAERILAYRNKSNSERLERASNNKFILPRVYPTIEHKSFQEDYKKEIVYHFEEAEMYYEYIANSKKLRSDYALFLLDDHARIIANYNRDSIIPENAPFFEFLALPWPYTKHKQLTDRNVAEYLSKRKEGKIEPLIPFPAPFPESVLCRISFFAADMLGQFDEEYLINGKNFEEQMGEIENKHLHFFISCGSNQRFVRLTKDYLSTGKVNYSPEPFTAGAQKIGLQHWIRFPLWINFANVSRTELIRDFEKALDGFLNSDYCKRSNITINSKSDTGNKSAGHELPSPTAALNALWLWRVMKIAGDKPIQDVFELPDNLSKTPLPYNQKGNRNGAAINYINTKKVRDSVKIADGVFTQLEAY